MSNGTDTRRTKPCCISAPGGGKKEDLKFDSRKSNEIMYLFRLKKAPLFCIFWLPMLLLSNKSHLVLIPQILFLFYIVSVVSLGNHIIYTKQLGLINKKRYKFEASLIILMMVWLIVQVQLFSNNSSAINNGFLLAFLILMSLSSIFIFIDFGIQFCTILYAYNGYRASLTDKIVMLLMLGFYPLGVFYIKNKIEKNKKVM